MNTEWQTDASRLIRIYTVCKGICIGLPDWKGLNMMKYLKTWQPITDFRHVRLLYDNVPTHIYEL